jgi:hypothetical protein
MKKKKYCLVTFLHKKELNSYERICLSRMNLKFQNEDKYVISPQNKEIKKLIYKDFINFKNIIFDKSFFKSTLTYNKLCTSLEFYEKFKNYEYILICHLDTYVIYNDIENFIKYDYSYIGAPSAHKSIFNKKKLTKVKFFCNGGFCLRKVDDFLKVLNSNKINLHINSNIFFDIIKNRKYFYNYIKLVFYSFIRLKLKGNNFAKDFFANEDVFWSYYAKFFYKKYKTPDKIMCLKFAFDGDPYFYYKNNKNKLPMAFHGHYNYKNFLKNIKNY